MWKLSINKFYLFILHIYKYSLNFKSSLIYLTVYTLSPLEQKLIIGTFVSDLLFKEGNSRFTRVSFKPLCATVRKIPTYYNQGAETSCLCVCNNELNSCTVGVYSTDESWYLYSLREYICLLLIFYLKISLIYML